MVHIGRLSGYIALLYSRQGYTKEFLLLLTKPLA